MPFDPSQPFEAVNDTPVTGQSGFDPSKPFETLDTEEPEGKSVSGFLGNAAEDVEDTLGGLGNLAGGMVTNPIDTGTAVAKNIIPSIVNEGKRIGVGELLTGHPINALEKFGNAAYEKPLSTSMDVLPALDIAKGAGLLGEAGEAGKVAETASLADKAEALANRGIFKEGNWSPKQVETLRNVGATPEEMGKVLTSTHLENPANVDIGMGTTTKDLLHSVEESKEMTGKWIGQRSKMLDDNGFDFDAKGLSNKYAQDATDAFSGSVTNQPKINVANKILTDFKTLEKAPSFSKAHALYTEYMDDAKINNPNAPEAVEPYRLARQVLKDYMGKNYGEYGYADDFNASNKQYAQMSQWEEALNRKLNAAEGGGDKLKGRFSTVGGIAGSVGGHAIGGYPGAIAGGLVGANLDLLPPINKLQTVFGRNAAKLLSNPILNTLAKTAFSKSGMAGLSAMSRLLPEENEEEGK